jgi:hypothetical protein
MEPFEAYTVYVAMKMHFNGNYDYKKYNGKIRSKQESFRKRSDKYHFIKISKKYNKDEFEKLLIANFIEKPNLWIGDLFDDECIDKYIRMKGRHESITHNFESDCQRLYDYITDNDLNFKDLFDVSDGQHPIILKKFLHGEICIESFLILDHIFGLFRKMDNHLNDTIVWTEIKKKCLKYRVFFDILIESKQKRYVKILKDIFV